MRKTPIPPRESDQDRWLAEFCLETAEDVGVRLRQARDADEIARLVRVYQRLGRILRLALTQVAR